MKIDILSLFPEMFEGFLNTSIIKRAIDKEVVDIKIHNFREFTQDKHKHVDDYPYGGGQGMVLMCQPIIDCLKTLTTDDSLVILMSPQGITLKHQVAQKLSLEKHLIIICGHYEGFDERIRDYVDLELSIGDYGGSNPSLPTFLRLERSLVFCGSSSVDRALAFQAEGRGFEPRLPLFFFLLL